MQHYRSPTPGDLEQQVCGADMCMVFLLCTHRGGGQELRIVISKDEKTGRLRYYPSGDMQDAVMQVLRFNPADLLSYPAYAVDKLFTELQGRHTLRLPRGGKALFVPETQYTDSDVIVARVQIEHADDVKGYEASTLNVSRALRALCIGVSIHNAYNRECKLRLEFPFTTDDLRKLKR